MPDGYELQAAELDSHAGHLDGVADQLRSAVDAATSVSLTTDAYGILCQFFPPLLAPVEHAGIESISKAVEAMIDNAKSIRDSAQAYRGQEDVHAGAFNRGMTS